MAETIILWKEWKEPRNIYIENLSFDTKIDGLHKLFGIR